MNVVGTDRIDFAGAKRLPKPFAIGRFTQRRIDLPDIASGPAHVVGKIMRAGLDVDDSAGATMAQGGFQGLGRGGVDDIEWCARRMGDICRALHGVGLDEWAGASRSRCSARRDLPDRCL